MAKKPIRSIITKASSKVPKGPLGVLGKGNVVGGAGFFISSAVNGIVPIDGVEVGFQVETHNVERSGNVEEHTFLVHSLTEQTARFAARYKSTPTNLNAIFDEVEVVSAEEVKERQGFSLWKIRTEVDTKGEIEKEEVEI